MVLAGLGPSVVLDDSESTGVDSELSDELEASSLSAGFLCFRVLVGFFVRCRELADFFVDEAEEASLLEDALEDA